MKYLTTKNLLIAGAFLAVIFLFYVLVLNSKPHDSHKQDREEVKAIIDTVSQRELVFNAENDSLKRANALMGAEIKSLRLQLSYKGAELSKSAANLRLLAAEVKAWRSCDTSSSYVWHMVDSLIAEVETIVSLLDSYKAINAELQARIDSQEQTYLSRLAQRERLYTDLRASFNMVTAKYNNLYVDYSSARKDAKLQRVLSKVAALIAIVEGGLLIIK